MALGILLMVLSLCLAQPVCFVQKTGPSLAVSPHGEGGTTGPIVVADQGPFEERSARPGDRISNATPAGIPGKPEGLLATIVNTTVRLHWSMPQGEGGILGYWVLRGSDQSSIAPLVELGNQTDYWDYGVSRGDHYFYEVLAYNAAGNGTASDPLSVTVYDPPSFPTIVRATANLGTVTLEWLPPSDDGGRSVTGYRLYRGDSMYTTAYLVDLGNVTKYEDTAPGTGTVYYSVSAVNVAGEGRMSMPVSAAPLGPPSRVWLGLIHIGDGFVDMSWEACPNDGGSPILGYMLRRGVYDDWLPTEIDVGLHLTYNDTDIINCVYYYYTLEAYNALGHGLASSIAEVFPHGPPPTPKGLAGEVVGGEVHLNWTRFGPVYHKPTTTYTVLRGKTPADLKTVVYSGPYPNTTDSGLRPGKTYYYAVFATNKFGRGARSQVIGIHIPGGNENLEFGLALSVGALAAAVVAMVRKRGRKRLGQDPGHDGLPPPPPVLEPNKTPVGLPVFALFLLA